VGAISYNCESAIAYDGAAGNPALGRITVAGFYPEWGGITVITSERFGVIRFFVSFNITFINMRCALAAEACRHLAPVQRARGYIILRQDARG